MKLNTDTENNVAYLSLVDDEWFSDERFVDRTVTVHATGGGQLNLDFDERGCLLGIEFMDAKTQLAAMKESFSEL